MLCRTDLCQVGGINISSYLNMKRRVDSKGTTPFQYKRPKGRRRRSRRSHHCCNREWPRGRQQQEKSGPLDTSLARPHCAGLWARLTADDLCGLSFFFHFFFLVLFKLKSAMFTKTIHLFSSGAQRGETKSKKKKMGNFQRANNKFGMGKENILWTLKVWRERDWKMPAWWCIQTIVGGFMCTHTTLRIRMRR